MRLRHARRKSMFKAGVEQVATASQPVLQTNGTQLLLQLGEELVIAHEQMVTMRGRGVADITSLTLFAFLTIFTSVT